jgi:hypothetical protein
MKEARTPMKRTLLLVVAGLVLLAGLAVVIRPGTGRAQDGAPFQGTPAGSATVDPNINHDIEVTPAQGPWMISVASYTGPDAPQMARDLVRVLRGPQYNLAAYVFNYGAEEKRKEMERRQALIQQQKQWLDQMRGQVGGNVEIGRMVVRTRHIEEQVAVLVGGYPDMETASRERKHIHDLDPKGLKGLKLDQRMFITPDETRQETRPVSPFQAAFVVHNPTVAVERPADADKLDVAALRRLNAGETYSLLNCPKPVTLAVAQYWLPAPLEKRGKDNSFLGKIGLGGSHDDRDPAAVPAHSLAEWLRKGNLEAYVLHTKCNSIVTVGGFDSLQDPHLKRTQDQLAELSTKLRRDPRCGQYLNLFAKPMPMQVPR